MNDDEYQSIVCPVCGKRSYNPNDVEMRYCGSCHQFHELMMRGRGTAMRVACVCGAGDPNPTTLVQFCPACDNAFSR